MTKRKPRIKYWVLMIDGGYLRCAFSYAIRRFATRLAAEEWVMGSIGFAAVPIRYGEKEPE